MSYNNHQLNIPNQPNTATSTTTTTTITHHQSDHNNQPKITSRPTGLTLDQLTSSISLSIPTCANCSTQTTPLWRRDESGATLCNACALFQKMKGRPRPISLKTDVIKQRNRIKAIDRDLHHHHHHHHHHSHSHSHSKLNKPTTQQNPKSKSHKNIKLISQHPPPPSPTPPLNQSRNLSDQINIKSSPVSLNENSYHDESEHSFQSTSNDIQESPAFNRSFTNPRKSEPGGVLDLDSPITTSNHPHSLSNEEFNVNQDWISYHSIGSKRRKEIFQSEPISISKRILNGKASQPNQFQSILIPDNQQQHPMTLTSIRSHSLNNFRSNGHKNHIRNSLGSTAEFQFDRDLISREEIQSPLHHHRQQQQQQSKLNERNEVMSHLKVPNLNQLSINSNLNLSPITSPLGRSISVDPHSNIQTPVSCSSSSSSSNERGRPRTRLPPLSQLVSRTFNETQSPSRLSGPPISFEESAREASYQSPQPKARVSSGSSSILPTYPLSFQHHPHPLVSQRTSSVSSSKSSDNESWHDSHPTRKPEILKPSTPPLFEEYNRHPSRATEERDEELMRLKQRVNELELINGMMKSKITELESKRQSWDGNSLGSCNLSTSSSAIEIADEDEHHQIDTSW